MSSTPTSQASTEVSNDTAALSNGHKGFRQRAGECAQEAAASQDILLFLIAFRILNALSIKTFFQPDEYFQSLEPAWQMAFGGDSGAWITWVGLFHVVAVALLRIVLGMEASITICYSSNDV